MDKQLNTILKNVTKEMSSALKNLKIHNVKSLIEARNAISHQAIEAYQINNESLLVESVLLMSDALTILINGKRESESETRSVKDCALDLTIQADYFTRVAEGNKQTKMHKKLNSYACQFTNIIHGLEQGPYDTTLPFTDDPHPPVEISCWNYSFLPKNNTKNDLETHVFRHYCSNKPKGTINSALHIANQSFEDAKIVLKEYRKNHTNAEAFGNVHSSECMARTSIHKNISHYSTLGNSVVLLNLGMTIQRNTQLMVSAGLEENINHVLAVENQIYALTIQKMLNQPSKFQEVLTDKLRLLGQLDIGVYISGKKRVNENKLNRMIQDARRRMGEYKKHKENFKQQLVLRLMREGFTEEESEPIANEEVDKIRGRALKSMPPIKLGGNACPIGTRYHLLKECSNKIREQKSYSEKADVAELCIIQIENMLTAYGNRNKNVKETFGKQIHLYNNLHSDDVFISQTSKYGTVRECKIAIISLSENTEEDIQFKIPMMDEIDDDLVHNDALHIGFKALTQTNKIINNSIKKRDVPTKIPALRVQIRETLAKIPLPNSSDIQTIASYISCMPVLLKKLDSCNSNDKRFYCATLINEIARNVIHLYIKHKKKEVFNETSFRYTIDMEFESISAMKEVEQKLAETDDFISVYLGVINLINKLYISILNKSAFGSIESKVLEFNRIRQEMEDRMMQSTIDDKTNLKEYSPFPNTFTDEEKENFVQLGYINPDLQLLQLDMRNRINHSDMKSTVLQAQSESEHFISSYREALLDSAPQIAQKFKMRHGDCTEEATELFEKLKEERRYTTLNSLLKNAKDQGIDMLTTHLYAFINEYTGLYKEKNFTKRTKFELSVKMETMIEIINIISEKHGSINNKEIMKIIEKKKNDTKKEYLDRIKLDPNHSASSGQAESLFK